MTISNALSRIGVGLFLCSGSMVLAQGPPGGAGPPGDTPGSPPVPDFLTVQVDCDNGESINDALATLAQVLTIEISGDTCTENVFVQRNFVTLRGETDGSGDPITTIVPAITGETPPTFGNTLLIANSAGITVENLIFSANGDEGIVAFRSGSPDNDGLMIRNCILVGNDNLDLVILSASNVTVVDSNVGTVNVFASSSLVMRRGELEGDLLARGGARVALIGVTQAAAAETTIRADSALFVRAFMGAPSTLGDVNIETLSRALLRFGTSVDSLMCESGGDAFCDGTSIPTNAGSTDCAQCP